MKKKDVKKMLDNSIDEVLKLQAKNYLLLAEKFDSVVKEIVEKHNSMAVAIADDDKGLIVIAKIQEKRINALELANKNKEERIKLLENRFKTLDIIEIPGGTTWAWDKIPEVTVPGATGTDGTWHTKDKPLITVYTKTRKPRQKKAVANDGE